MIEIYEMICHLILLLLYLTLIKLNYHNFFLSSMQIKKTYDLYNL